MTDATSQIKDTITKNDVVLFMKGTKSMPQCGFSRHQELFGLANHSSALCQR